jgi:hypothetical protein
MRVRSPSLLIALGLCTGCANPNGLGPSAIQTGSCLSPSKQVSLVTLPCERTDGWPPGIVVTNPDGGGPQVEIWGPPSWSGGDGAG